MIVRRTGGLTEFIPSPQEKRDGLIRDHALGLLENLHLRLARLERASGLPPDEAKAFVALPSVRRPIRPNSQVVENKHVKCRLRLFFYLICVRKEAFIHGVNGG